MRCRTTRVTAGPVALGVALVVGAVLAGCGTVSHDNPAFTGKPATGSGSDTPASTGPSGPGISEVPVGSVTAPRLASGAGAAGINSTVAALARQLGAGGRSCDVTTTRSDAALVSFRWLCSDRSVETATFSVASGRRLALGDLLRGGYLGYMSSVAQAQLSAGGATGAAASAMAAPTAAAFSRWGLSATAVQVTFPLASGPVTVGYPVSTLTPYLVPDGLLH